uniref:Uncharacterized protein n=3 Tax=Spermatophyta TaxID=58024 RepID=A0A0D6R7Y4_ARACU
MKDMTPSWTQNANGPLFTSASTSTSTSTSQTSICQCPSNTHARQTGDNVFRLLSWREISPHVKRPLKHLWGEAARSSVDCSGPRREVTDARNGLTAWVEADSLRKLSAKYCPLVPPPRSTIAAAFSPDGQTLASTHGDHTVKIIYCQTGTCLKVLSGHRRTPWVVRFHPSHPEILASGSLDHEVRIWDANSAECIGSRDFYRPIASIAFHAQGDLLAVASGHKLYIWQYNKRGDASSPLIVLRTRRSLRAVHFHPRAAPLLLTAEVNDLDSPDSPMTLATSPGYLQYPPPAVLFTPVHTNTGSGNSESGVNLAPLAPLPSLFWPAAIGNESDVQSSQADGRVVETVSPRHSEANAPSSQIENDIEAQTQNTTWAVPMDVTPQIAHGGPSSELLTSSSMSENLVNVSHSNEMANSFYGSGIDTFRAIDRYGSARESHRSSPLQESENAVFSNENVASDRFQPVTTSFQEESSSRLSHTQRRAVMATTAGILPSNMSINMNLHLLLGAGSSSQLHQFLPVADHIGWELPFLQGWLMGQTQAGLSPNLPIANGSQRGMFGMPNMLSEVLASESHGQQNQGISLLSSTMAGIAAARVAGRSGVRHHSQSQLHTSTSTGASGVSAGVVVTGIPPTANVDMNISNEDRDMQHNLGAAEADSSAAQATMAAAAAAAAAELPCTVKLRIWPHNVKDPSALLDPETCRLTIPHAVLCSEMGAHFSPCGRFLAACVACVLPQHELEAGLHSQPNHGVGGLATSPTRHPISAQQVVYELRIYSLEETTFGEVLASRAIRAAHCLTSIQFSPTSAHILLAYGRRHNSLLRSILVDGTTTVPIYTILEIYRVSDMELVRVLPSAEDEVNVACFHPLVGGGLVYGTKEGKLRILQYDRTQGQNYGEISSGMEHNMSEVQTIALEC